MVCSGESLNNIRTRGDAGTVCCSGFRARLRLARHAFYAGRSDFYEAGVAVTTLHIELLRNEIFRSEAQGRNLFRKSSTAQRTAGQSTTGSRTVRAVLRIRDNIRNRSATVALIGCIIEVIIGTSTESHPHNTEKSKRRLMHRMLMILLVFHIA